VPRYACLVNSGLLARAHHAACDWLDRHRAVCLVGLAAWLLILLGITARGRAFWHDEVYTVLTAQLSIPDLLRADRDGIDLAPPLNTIATHVVQAIAGPGEIVSRVPPMAGFAAAAILLSLTVRRRTNAIAALLPPLILAVTPAWMYGTEARGYALSLCWSALALYSWTEAIRGIRPTFHWTVMGAALAAAVWTHYFAALAALPIVAGEITRQLRYRTFSAAPWIAGLAAVLAVLPLWPLASAAASQRSQFWARASTVNFGEAYRFAFRGLDAYKITLFVLILIVAVELFRRARWRAWPRQLAAHDLAAVVVALALPAAGALFGYWTGVFSDRYLTFTIADVAFAVPILLWTLTPRCGLGEWVAAVALAASLIDISRDLRHHLPPHARIDDHPLLREWLKSEEMMAVTGGIDFLALWYSLDEPTRSRVVHLADPDSELHFEGADTVERGYLALSRWTPVQVARVKLFTRTHRHFMLYAFDVEWQLRGLADVGATLIERARENSGSGVLYEVTVPE